MTADWNDLDAAVARAAPRAAAAVLNADPQADPIAGATRTVRLLTIDDQQATVTATLGAPWSIDSGPVPVEITAALGAPDDPARAAALARLVARELRDLAGRRIRPD